MVVAEDVQMALAVIRACTLHRNPDGSMPLKRIGAIWDAAYEAGDTTRAFCYHRFAAIRNMLADMGLLEWEDCTYRFGRACRWRASERLMGMMERGLKLLILLSLALRPSLIATRSRTPSRKPAKTVPNRSDCDPRMVFPSLMRTDWDAKLAEAGLEHLARAAA